MHDLEARVTAARDAVFERLGELRPRVAMVLGSGLSADSFEFRSKVEIPVERIPNVPKPSVVGHRPVWTAGRIRNHDVLIAAGRVHRYEGYGLAEATLAVRVMAALGCESLFLTNAAGGIRDDLVPGTLMRISDHINLLGDSPLVGLSDAAPGDRFIDMSEPYDSQWAERARSVASDNRIELAEGVYACCLGPQYETPAEVTMLERLGADAVGMSTVPEVIAARHCGLRVFGLSLISNRAAGRSETPLSHEEVLEAGESAEGKLAELLTAILPDS